MERPSLCKTTLYKYFQVVTYFIFICFHCVGGVIKWTVDSGDHLLHSFGSERIATHFQSKDQLLGAIEHAWWIHSSSTTSRKVVACTELWKAREALEEAKAANISVRTIYHSSRENLACHRFSFRYEDIHFLESSDLVFLSIFPQLDVLKLDISIPHTLGLIEEFGASLSTFRFEDSKSHHPLLKHVASSETVVLQVIFNEGSPSSAIQASFDHWIERQGSGNHHQAESNLDSFYWTSNLHLNKTDDDFPFARSLMFGRQYSRLWKLNSNISYYTPVKHWRRWQTRWQAMGPNMYDTCRFFELKMRLRKDAAFLTYMFGDLEDSSSGACLAFMVHRIASDDSVLHVGFSRPLALQNKNTRAIVQGGGGREPFKIAGLDGSGEVVGHSDTGIDQYSCYFRDPFRDPLPPSHISAPKVDLQRRKVVQYIDFAGGSGDYAGGHGSHVSGSPA